MIIKNRAHLLSHGNLKGRQAVLDIIDSTMEQIDASLLTLKRISLKNNILTIDNSIFNLSQIDNIYVLGAGKGVFQIAEALEEKLGDRISKGLVIEKRMEGMARGLERINKFKRIEVLQASHPVPDDAAVEASKKLLAIAKQAAARDLVFFCVQGGCTCLTTLPAKGLTLEDIKKTSQILLESGTDIVVQNAVRNALTSLSSGRLAEYIHPAAIVNLVVNDYVLRYPQAAQTKRYGHGWGPSVPVPESRQEDFAKALTLLSEDIIWGKISKNVKNHLINKNVFNSILTKRDFERIGIRHHTFILADPQDAVEAAYKTCSSMKLNPLILSSSLEGEAKEVGIMLAGIATEIARNHRPVKTPCAVLCAGEKTVTLSGAHGEGGRNQECVLSAAQRIENAHKVVIASVGTDGTDGPTGIAGGIVDGFTVQRAKELGINLTEVLQSHSSAQALTGLGDAIYFNEPGNNLCDLTIIVIKS